MGVGREVRPVATVSRRLGTAADGVIPVRVLGGRYYDDRARA
jgi:hypothetical protein